jgi:hypothetical protein
MVEAALAQAPDDLWARVVLAEVAITEGRQIRGGTGGRDVTTEGFRGFLDTLHEAERQLIGITADHPDCADVWNLRLSTTRALSPGIPEAQCATACLFALAFSPAELPGETAPHFCARGEAPPSVFWGYFPTIRFLRTRAKALRGKTHARFLGAIA